MARHPEAGHRRLPGVAEGRLGPPKVVTDATEEYLLAEDVT